MDDIWQAFASTEPKAYVAHNENAITLCSSASTVQGTLRKMAELLDQYDEPLVLATSLYLEDDYYYMTIILSGFRIDV